MGGMNWTPEEDKLVVELRHRRVSWEDVAKHLGRTVNACFDRYKRVTPKEQRIRYLSQSRWSESDETAMRQMLAENKPIKQIAAALGRTVSTVHSKIYYERSYHTRQFRLEATPRVFVPPDREKDRDRRMAAERDLTSIFFGDPAPGQSALDKKQGAYA